MRSLRRKLASSWRRARSLERAGADFLVSLYQHDAPVAGAIEAAVRLPLLHIADARPAEIAPSRDAPVGLLGTRSHERVLQRRLQEHGLEVLTPGAKDRPWDRIYEELFGRDPPGLTPGVRADRGIRWSRWGRRE